MRSHKGLLAVAVTAASLFTSAALAENENKITWKYAEITKLSGDVGNTDAETDGFNFAISAMISDTWYFNGEYHGINNDGGAEFNLDHTTLSIGRPMVLEALNSEDIQTALHAGVSFEHVDTGDGSNINQISAGQPGAGSTTDARRESGYGYHVGFRARTERLMLGIRYHQAFFSNGPDETFLRGNIGIKMGGRLFFLVNYETLDKANIDEFGIGIRVDFDGA